MTEYRSIWSQYTVDVVLIYSKVRFRPSPSTRSAIGAIPMNISNLQIEPCFADAIAMIEHADELPVEKKSTGVAR